MKTNRSSIQVAACCVLGVLGAAAGGAFAEAGGDGGGDAEILWQFQTGAITLDQFITVSPDGTIYTSDNEGLYALTPQGELIWFVEGLGGGRSIGRGGDGTLYVTRTLSNNPTLVAAVSPAGEVIWEFVPPQIVNDVHVGPNVGPDGNIYATQDADPDGAGGLGMFSLDPAGNLRWSNVGDPPLFTLDGGSSPVVFTEDRLYIGMITLASGPPIPRSFDFDGNQVWYGFGMQVRSYPRLDPMGRVIATWGQTGVQAIEPGPNATVAWSEIHPGNPQVMLRPTIGSDGTIYAGDYLGVELWALTPEGETIWVRPNDGNMLEMLTIGPDDETMIAGGTAGFGMPAWVRGYGAADGSPLWQVDVPAENGAISLVNSYDAAFSPDGTTAYVNIQFAGNVNDYGYLIAIRFADPPAASAGDITGDGLVDAQDMLMLLGAWGPCPQLPAPCPADIAPRSGGDGGGDGDGVVDALDFLMVIANWS